MSGVGAMPPRGTESSLSWDTIAAMAARFDKPAAGCILVDTNMPSDLCATLPRSEDAVRAMYGYGHYGDDAWSIVQRLRAQDWAIVIPVSAEDEIRTRYAYGAGQPPPPPDHPAFFGLPMYRVHSRPSAPWDALRAQGVPDFPMRPIAPAPPV